MALIKSQLQLNDQMTSVLRKMNGALMTCLDSFESMQRASGQAIDVDNIAAARSQLIGVNQQIESMTGEQERFNRELDQGTGAAGNLLSKLAAIAATYVSISSMKNLVADSLEAADTQISAQVQLKTVMGNMDSLDYYDQVLDKARDIQSKGIYGDEAMIAGAAELSTYFSDGEALLSMMDTLSNYAMGMSGGGALDPKAMTDYATGIGKIMTGSYDAMTKKGFEFSDAQKALIEGTATQAQIVDVLGESYVGVSKEMLAAATIGAVIDESWAGLYETMSATPESQMISFQNTLGDIKETIGAGLYPAVLNFMTVFQENLPMIEEFASGFVQAVGTAMEIVTWLTVRALEFASVIQDNWGWIGPIVWAIVAAMVVYKTVTLLQAAAQWVLNSALLACPLTWIALAIGVVIAALIAWINSVGGLTNAWNICKAALTVAWNAIQVGWYATVYGLTWGVNKVLDFVDLLKLGWQAAGVAIANFIGDMKVSVLMILQNMVNGAIDIINGFISTLNLIPGVNISAIEHVTFATEAAVENEAKKQARAEDLAAYQAGIAEGQAAREANLQAAKANLDNSIEQLGASAAELADLYSASTAAAANNDNGYQAGTIEGFVNDSFGYDLSGNVSDIADNTGSTAANLKTSTEDLKYLRDIAEQEAINRFTTAEVKIDMTGMTNKIDSDMDLDGVLVTLTEGFAEALEIAAEGVHV